MVYNPVNPGDALSSSVTDINDAFDGLARWFAGSTAPASPEALMRWFDTASNILYVRNTGNTSWIPCKVFDTETGFMFSDGTDAITVCAPAALSGDYTLKLPTAQGGSSTFLQNDGSGNLSWTAGGASGVTELGALTDVSISGDTRGDVLVRGASNWTRLPIGSNGQVLGSDGTDIQWQSAGGGGTLAGLGDTAIVSATSGEYLRFNGSAWTDSAPLLTDLVVGSQSNGDLAYFDGSEWTRLPKGSVGQVLEATAGSIQWAAPSGGGSTTLEALTDTTITAAASGDYLRHNGSAWVDAAGIDIGDLTVASEAQGDLIVRGASGWERLQTGANGQVLTTNGTTLSWGAAGGGSTTLEALTDTTITAAASGDYLRHNGSAWVDAAGIDIGDLTVASEAQGDVIVRGSSGWERLPLGLANTFLTSNGTDAQWGSPSLAVLSDTALGAPAAGNYLRYTGAAWVNTSVLMSDLFETNSTTGDLAYHDGANWSRLARGSDGQVLEATATSIQWATPATGTTLDGLTDTTIAAAATGDYLRHNGSAWVDAAGIDIGDLTVTSEAQGDLIVRGASGWERLGVGTNGQVLTTDGTDVSWGAGGGGSATFAGLEDTSITSPASGEGLIYDGTDWGNVATTGTGSIARAASPTFSGTANFTNIVASQSITMDSFIVNALIGTSTFAIIMGSSLDDQTWIIPNSTTLPTTGEYYMKINSTGNISYSAT